MAAITKSARRPDAAPRPRPTWRVLLLLFLAACVVEALLLTVLAARRAVNADEGFYVLAGWRVLGGQRPYADFFFPQMPYLPYLDAAVLALTGPSLFAGRAVSVASAALLAGVLAVAAAQRSGRPVVGVAVAMAYAANALVLSYLTIAKTYGVANLALVVAVLLVADPGTRTARAFAAGVCASIAVGTRLPSIAVLGVLLLWTARGGLRPLGALCAGALLGLLPCVWLANQDPQGFWFGNVEFHALRREIEGLTPILTQKAVVLAKWVLLPQNLVLWALASVGLYQQPRQGVLTAACALALAVGYLTATPTYLEYMVQVLPFLLLTAIPGFAWLLRRRMLMAAGAGLYLIGLVAARRQAPHESLRGEKARLWDLDTVRAVAEYLRTRSEPGDRILSWWEGYPLLAQRAGFAGVGFWESNVAKKLPADARRRYHLLYREDIAGLVAAREPRLIVFPRGTWADLKDVLVRDYTPTARFGAIEVFELRERYG